MDAIKNLKNLLTMYFGSMPDDTIYTILKDAESEMDEKNKEITRLTGKATNADFLLQGTTLMGISQISRSPKDDPLNRFGIKVGIMLETHLPPEVPFEMYEGSVKRCLERFQNDKR